MKAFTVIGIIAIVFLVMDNMKKTKELTKRFDEMEKDIGLL